MRLEWKPHKPSLSFVHCLSPGFFDAAELQGRAVEVGGAVYVFPSYCAVLGEPDDCLTNKTITIGVQVRGTPT